MTWVFSSTPSYNNIVYNAHIQRNLSIFPFFNVNILGNKKYAYNREYCNFWEHFKPYTIRAYI